MMLASTSMANVDFEAIVLPSFPQYETATDDKPDYGLGVQGFLEVTMMGIGQVVFCSNMASCVVLLFALAICSRRIAVSECGMNNQDSIQFVLCVYRLPHQCTPKQMLSLDLPWARRLQSRLGAIPTK